MHKPRALSPAGLDEFVERGLEALHQYAVSNSASRRVVRGAIADFENAFHGEQCRRVWPRAAGQFCNTIGGFQNVCQNGLIETHDPHPVLAVQRQRHGDISTGTALGN